ncbi:MAG TPA: AMP-binding protein [Stellaceae bacterium]|nr:AMP-binding protein [Stellaceae bacterium]
MIDRVDVPWYHKSLDFPKLWEEFPPPPDFLDTVYTMSADEIRAVQDRRFRQQIARGWEVPFYQIHWRKAGLEPGDIRSLDDISKIPPYSVHELRESIERCPPFGDYMGIELGKFPLVLQTSGGTTGLPRPMLYSPRDREVMNILGGRRYYLQGIRPGHIVQSTYSIGLSNGGFATREGLWKYTGSIPVMTGSGSSTPTRRQIEIAKAWGVSHLFGFPAYLRHMALVARDEMRIDPRELGLRSLGSHMGPDDRTSLEELWGAPVYDMYGTNESGMIACDCELRRGMHIQEDAYVIEIVDPETNRPMPAGERGNIYITCLFKYAAPVIRFNVNDISAIALGSCACGGTHRRLEKIYGRADNMVKLRGVNLFPEAVGALIAEDSRSTGEYVCIVERVGEAGRDEMTVMVEMTGASVDGAALRRDLEQRFREALSVKLIVQPVERGALDRHTGLSQTSKIKRLIDKREH